jgi:ABC-type sulfate/molybdate transport systems ATPase subunit
MPVKRYSSGMYARLGFSIASHVEPQVLLVDEVLSVGDAVFRLRCLDRMHSLVRDGTTLVFVTHNLEQMREICRRAIVLDGGKVSFHGPPAEAVGHYLQAMSRVYAERPADLAEEGDSGVGSIELQSFRLLNAHGEEAVWIHPNEETRIELTFRLARAIPRLIVEANLRAPANNVHVSLNSGRDATTFACETGLHRITLSLAKIPLAGGQYFWNVRMWDADSGAGELDTPFRYPMVINDDGKATGAICLDHGWTLDADISPMVGGAMASHPAENLQECGSRV